MESVELHGKKFEEFITPELLTREIERIADEVQKSHGNDNPLFLGLLNGSFLFAAELFKRFKGEAEVAFVRAKSYAGLQSSGKVEISTLPKESIQNRHVIVIEDIVDSGNTLNNFLPILRAANPESIKLATMLFKPDALKHNIPIDYCGFKIPDKFVVGFGLDYDGIGRNLPGIYSLAEELE